MMSDPNESPNTGDGGGMHSSPEQARAAISDAPSRGAIVAADRLPPVEPPAAGFIIQLFLIPMVIVSIIVAVWLVFGWMARAGNDPQRLVEDLERMNHSSWQQALTLANLLEDPRNSGIRRNTILAKRLGDILKLHLNEGHTDKDHIELRYFLCMALGEFETAETLPILVQAANKEDDPSEVTVRRGAVWAMGRLAEHQGSAVLASSAEAMQALERAATDGEDQQPGADADGKERFLTRGRLRSTAVFVLGKVGDERAKQIIAARLFSDPHPDTRYNAAAQLARLGDDRALPLLVEMMDPDNSKASQFESGDAEKTWKRQEVIMQGMEAVSAWLTTKPDIDAQTQSSDGASREDLKQSVQKVIDADFGGLVQTRALDLLRILNEK